jgi:helicase MOV-10
VKRYCVEADGHFGAPRLEVLRGYRIVVATCCMAAKMHHLGVPRGHFGAVFVDEAGNAFEPEVVAAFAGFVAEPTQLVLAGDPKQLGPVARSAARELGLGESLLERLMARPAYARDPARFPAAGDRGYDARVLTKLVRNYRSHPALLELPNALFYDGDLVACADPAVSQGLARWQHLPPGAAGFPLLFHAVEGANEREGNSPSWFNTTECAQVPSPGPRAARGPLGRLGSEGTLAACGADGMRAECWAAGGGCLGGRAGGH